MNDLRQLRHFVALAEHGHFARAAAAVNLSQPALSRSIQSLEASLGCNLLDRHSRGIHLTAHGELVLEHARRLLAGSLALKSAVSQLGNLQSGELRLGAGPYPAARLVPAAIGRFAQNYPRVQVQLLIENWRNLRELLLNDAIELFVADIRDLQDDPRLQITPLPNSPIVLFCRPDHPLLGEPQLQPGDLLGYPLAGTQIPHSVAERFELLLGHAQPFSVECDNFMVLKALVAQSDVVSLAPWDVIAEDVEHGRLALLPLTQDVPRQQSAYGVVSRAGHSLSPAAQVLLAALREEDRAFRQAAP